MTNEELYERINSTLKEQGVGINQFESKVRAETGKYPNLKMTKSRLSLPNTVAFPYLTMFFNDDEMHELTLKKIDSVGDNGEAFDLLDEILSSLEPSKEYLYKQRLKRKMQRGGSKIILHKYTSEINSSKYPLSTARKIANDLNKKDTFNNYLVSFELGSKRYIIEKFEIKGMNR